MLKFIVLSVLIFHLVNCKTVFKRQTCDIAIDYTRVPGTCNQYYRCFGGYSATISCNAGFEFSTELKSCRPDSEVNCSTRGDECTDDIDYAKVTNDCVKYFRCINGYLSIESCQEGLVYNVQAKACDWPENVPGCEKTYWGNECTVDIDYAKVTNDCVKYYRCINGYLSIESCQEGYVYNVQAKACDWPENVPGCEKTYWGNECNMSIDLTRDPNDCTKFRRCDKGYIVIKSCNDNLFFDNNLQVCNWPDQVPECQIYSYGNECDVSSDLTRYPDDCKKYYRCKNGFLTTEICPDGLAFDVNLKRCEWASTVSCNSFQSNCENSQDLTQVPNDCSKYYRCSNGVLTIENCPNGYAFDISLKACNLKSLVSTCQQIQECTQADDLTQVPGNCNQFYRCINNVLQIESCPNGYSFDRSLKACNIAGQVYTCF